MPRHNGAEGDERSSSRSPSLLGSSSPSPERDTGENNPRVTIEDESEEEHPSSFAFKHRVKRPSRFGGIFGSSSRDNATSSVTLDTLADQPTEEPLFQDDASVLDYPDFSTSNYIDGESGGAIRRVVYDDLTAIDWIHEYNVERARKRHLSKDRTLYGQLKLFMDPSKLWFVLIATGIAAGVIAAAIDIASLWLSDIKGGFCSSSFYLSRAFCCWGIENSSECKEWTTWAQSISANSKSGAFAFHYFVYIIFSVLFAVCASILVAKYAPYAKHSGIPEIKTLLGGFVIRRFLGSWTLIIKSCGLCLASASGLWLGKEGPLIHVTCCCANLFMKPFSSLSRNEARKREVLSAAAAAGISVAFGAPIGGVLFSLETLSYYFPDKIMWHSFVSAMVAAVTLQAMNPFRTKKLVLYQVTYSRTWHDFEMIPFAVLGIIGGIYGGLFIKFNMWIANRRKNSRIRFFPVTEVVVIAILSAVINYPNVFMRVQTSEIVAQLFQECKPKQEDFFEICQEGKTAGPVLLLVCASLMAAVLSALTFGIQLPAGILLPTMAIGALYGRALGMVIQVWQRRNPTHWMQKSCLPDVECITPGVYAIVGAASALGGVTRMTVAIVVIMFELTGALTYVLPIMIAVMLSKWVGDVFDTRGIYESWINFKEYPYLENRDDPVPDVPCTQVMTRVEDLIVITATGQTIESLNSLLRSQTYKGFPVVSNTREAIIEGFISRSDLKFALEHATRIRNLPESAECFFTTPPALEASSTAHVDLRQWMDQTPITLPSNSNLLLAASLFQKLGLKYILFVNQGQLQGLITKKDAWFILNSNREFRRQETTRDAEDLADREARGLLAPDSDGDDVSSIATSPLL